MSSLTIQRRGRNDIIICGDLTFTGIDKKTVSALPPAKTGSRITVDLGQVTAVDSAGLALLIEWLKLARNRQFQLLFKDIPEQLLELARANGFADLLRQSQ